MGMFDEKKKGSKKANDIDKFITIIREIGKGDNVKVITKHMKNNGTMKYSSKKEKRLLKAICPHHSLNHKGNIRSRIVNDGDGHCQCTICHQTFSSKINDKADLKAMRKMSNELCNQTKYIAVSSGASDRIVQIATIAQYFINLVYKCNKEVSDFAKKQESVMKKKKGNNRGNHKNGSWTPKNGSWN